MPVIAATGNPTGPALAAAIETLLRHNLTVEVIPPDGHGRKLEGQIRDGLYSAVFDFSPVELLTGRAGPDRLTAAGATGVPQLISVSGLDFHSDENRPTTPEERDALGKVIVERASAAKGPTRIALPLHGFRGEGADDPLFQSIRNWVYPPKLLVEFDFAVNDSGFGAECAEALLGLIESR